MSIHIGFYTACFIIHFIMEIMPIYNLPIHFFDINLPELQKARFLIYPNLTVKITLSRFLMFGNSVYVQLHFKSCKQNPKTVETDVHVPLDIGLPNHLLTKQKVHDVLTLFIDACASSNHFDKASFSCLKLPGLLFLKHHRD